MLAATPTVPACLLCTYHMIAQNMTSSTISYHRDTNRCSTANVEKGTTRVKPMGVNAKRYSARCQPAALFHCSIVHGLDWLYWMYLVLLLSQG